MNIILLLQGRTVEDQVGWHRAFQTLVNDGTLTGYHPLPYLIDFADGQYNLDPVYAEARRILDSERVDLLLLQWFHGPIGRPVKFLDSTRRRNPDCLIATTCGDGFGCWFNQIPPSLTTAASRSDLVFTTSMGHVARRLEKAGARNVCFSPNGACDVRFGGELAPRVRAPEFDVIFIGSRYRGRNVLSPLYRAGVRRAKMVTALTRRYGKRFGLFGRGWQGQTAWQGCIDYAAQLGTARRAFCQVGGFPGSVATYYQSDRFPIALASGVPFLDAPTPRLDRVFEPGKHFVPYSSTTSLLRAVDTMLTSDGNAFLKMGDAAREFVLGRHMQSHRAREIVTIAEQLLHHRRKSIQMPPPALACFRPEISIQSEQQWAIVNWRG